MIRAILLLDLRRLFSARLRTLLAVVAVAAGSSLALSVLVVRSSVTSSLRDFGRQVAGVAPLRVVGAETSGGLEANVLDAVRHTPGVATAVPVVQSTSVVHAASGRATNVVVLGLDCTAGALVGERACASSDTSPPRTVASPAGATSGPTAPSPSPSPSLPPPARSGGAPVVVSRALGHRLGASSWLESPAGIVPLSGRRVASGLDRVNHGAVVVLALPEAQRLFDRAGRLDAIYVLPSRAVSVPGLRARLARAVGSWNGVLSASDPPPQVSIELGTITPLLTLLAVLASAIAVVLVYNIVALSLEQRRRERAVAAAVGAPPAVLAAGPLTEAALLGGIGGLFGAAIGSLLAGPIVHSMSTTSERSTGVPITVHTSPATFALGLFLGLAIAVLAAIRPLRRAARVDVATELGGRERRAEHTRTFSFARGGLFTAVAFSGLVISWVAQRHGALAPWQLPAATLAFLVCVAASVLAVGYWAPVVLRRTLIGGRWRGTSRLALANLVREPSRTGVVAVALAASVGVAFMTASFNRSVHDGIAQGLASPTARRAVLVSTVANAQGLSNLDARVPSAVLGAAPRVRGVAKVEPEWVALAGQASGTLIAVETAPDLAGGPALDAGRADQIAYRRGEVMVGASLARKLRLGPGSKLPLDTPGGWAAPTVEGVWEYGDFAGDNVVLSPAAFERLFGPQLPLAVNLVAAPGVSLGALRAQVQTALGSPDLTVRTPAQQLADASSSVSAQLAPFWALQRALLLVAFVSVLSTMLLAGLERRRELGILSAIGAAPLQQLRVVVLEALALGAVSCVLGAAMGVVDMASLLQVTPLLAGFHDPFRLDGAALVLYVPLTVAVAIVASLWPGWRALRLRVTEALQYE